MPSENKNPSRIKQKNLPNVSFKQMWEENYDVYQRGDEYFQKINLISNFQREDEKKEKKTRKNKRRQQLWIQAEML